MVSRLDEDDAKEKKKKEGGDSADESSPLPRTKTREDDISEIFECSICLHNVSPPQAWEERSAAALTQSCYLS